MTHEHWYAIKTKEPNLTSTTTKGQIWSGNNGSWRCTLHFLDLKHHNQMKCFTRDNTFLQRGYGISTIVGYLMPNPINIYLLNIRDCKNILLITFFTEPKLFLVHSLMISSIVMYH